MPRRSFALLVTFVLYSAAVVLLAMPARAQYVWSGAGNGYSWGDEQNWDPQAVPNESASATVASGTADSVVVRGSAKVGSLTVEGAELVVHGSSGILSAEGILFSGGTIRGEGTVVSDGSNVLQGVRILEATLRLDGTTTCRGHVGLTRAAELENAGTLAPGSTDASCTIEMFDSTSVRSSGQVLGHVRATKGPGTFEQYPRVKNSGEWRVYGGPGVMDATFDNSGTFEVLSHSEEEDAVTLPAGGSSIGSFTVGAGAALQFWYASEDRPRHALSGARFSGDGRIIFNVPYDIALNGSYQLNAHTGRTDIHGPHVTFPGTGALSLGRTLHIGSGAASVDLPVTLQELYVGNATLDGAGDVLVEQEFMLNGRATIRGAKTVTSQDPESNLTYDLSLLDGAALELHGRSDIRNELTLRMGDGARLVNHGSFELGQSGSMLVEGSVATRPAFLNAGSLVNQYAKPFTVEVDFINAGDIRGGGFAFSGDFENSASGLVTGNSALVLDSAASVAFSGTIAPGDSLGYVSVHGMLPLAAEAELSLDVAGSTPITEHDQLMVVGAELKGMLRVDVGAAGAGDYLIVRRIGEGGTISGTFDDFAVTPAGYEHALTYGPDGVLLSITGSPTRSNEPEAPSRVVQLHGNRPNPFSLATSISFELAAAAEVELALFDVLGRRVAVLAQGRHAAGTHTARFEPDGLPAGLYLYRLTVGDRLLQRTMMLVR